MALEEKLDREALKAIREVLGPKALVVVMVMAGLVHRVPQGQRVRRESEVTVPLEQEVRKETVVRLDRKEIVVQLDQEDQKEIVAYQLLEYEDRQVLKGAEDHQELRAAGVRQAAQ